MQLTDNDGLPIINTSNYQLVVPADRPFVYLNNADGSRLAELFVLSGVQPLDGRDDTTSIGSWQVVVNNDQEIVLELSAQSSVWDAKIIRLCCQPNEVHYTVSVSGNGRLATYQPFGGYYSGNLRWGSGFFYSGQTFQQGFNPEPNIAERNFFVSAENSTIDLIGVPVPGLGDWFFTPPPFCFAFQTDEDRWLSLGIAAQPGENRFNAYRYHGQHNAFHLSLDYEGYTRVNGHYQLPDITIHFGTDPYDTLQQHADSLRTHGNAPTRLNPVQPAWWHEPIFCGWGPQCHIAATEKGRAPDFARQDLYEQFLVTLADNQINPGIVVLDDKWQATYGDNMVDSEKWPDIRGFISQQHEQGRKVLLWLKAWDSEGLPDNECIRNAAGQPVSFDPTNPAFEQRLRAAVQQMLSPTGYNADGFKLDFTARIPSGPGMQIHGDVWGLELMKTYLNILHSAAKQVKSDALIMTHTPHPYLADVVDMIRLNDINTGTDVNKAMQHRAQIAAIGCPTAIIDTDNWPITDRAAWRAYLPLQVALGVPSLYVATHIDTTGEPLEPQDYQLIRDVWAKHRAKRSQQ